jgi:spore coat polysaccharide biosynthesis protein SpsF (cytidylyltransferase family)
MPFADTTVLDVAVSRLANFAQGHVVLATSDLSSDDSFEAMARTHDAAIVRGPSDDLLARFVEVIADYPAEHLVRVIGDSPFIDHTLVEQIVDAHLESNADYTSNTLLRTHPGGLDVEVIRSDALLDAAEQATDAAERDGVTTFVQRRPSEYNLHAVLAAGDYEDHNWQITDQASATRLTELLNRAGGDLTKPWETLLPHDKPEQHSAPIRLRVARENVLTALPNMTESVGFPPDPFPLREASRRSWGVWAGEDLVGAVSVAVQNGWGTLAGHFNPGLSDTTADQTMHAVDERLLSDQQVIALTIDGSMIRNYRD